MEARLRSWQPRRPSDGLKQRIFSRPHFSGSTLHLDIVGLCRWLAPVTACLLVVVSVMHQHIGYPASRHGSLDLGALGNNDFSLLQGNYRQEHNDFSALTLEWTKRSSSTSSIGSLSPNRGY
jgi:hypothetical protein